MLADRPPLDGEGGPRPRVRPKAGPGTGSARDGWGGCATPSGAEFTPGGPRQRRDPGATSPIKGEEGVSRSEVYCKTY